MMPAIEDRTFVDSDCAIPETIYNLRISEIHEGESPCERTIAQICHRQIWDKP